MIYTNLKYVFPWTVYLRLHSGVEAWTSKQSVLFLPLALTHQQNWVAYPRYKVRNTDLYVDKSVDIKGRALPRSEPQNGRAIPSTEFCILRLPCFP